MTNKNDTAVLAWREKSFLNLRSGRLACGLLAVFLLPPFFGLAQERKAMNFEFNRIPAQYRSYATALGQRLVKPGKERITVSGYLSYNPESQEKALPIQIILQYPMKIRVTLPGSSMAFNRFSRTQNVPPPGRLAETIQLLLEDSVEGFLAIRSTVGLPRHLGSGYALANAAAGSPGIDIVQMTYPDVFQNGQPIVKTYWFNSITKLLGMVGYFSASGARVDIVIDDWRDVEGEKIPFLIERYEDSKLTMRLTLSSAAVTAGIEDGTFGGN